MLLATRNGRFCAVAYAKELGCEIPIVLHLDHGDTFELCKNCIDSGFSSVMIDGSHHSYEDNIALTKQVVEYAHAHGVTVEGELGVLAGEQLRPTGYSRFRYLLSASVRRKLET
jgi:fructose-bisphosphate aldolase class II